MHIMVALLALLAAPFWEAKAPRDWSEEELRALLHDSPWAQGADPAPAVQVCVSGDRRADA